MAQSLGQLAYLGKVCSISYPVHHLLSVRVHGRHMGPHPLPGDTLYRKTRSINVEKNPSILLLFLLGGSRAVLWGRQRGGLLGAAAEETVRAGALGPAMPAQLGCRGASPVWGVGSSHWPQEEVEEEEEKLGQAIFLQLQELLFVSEQCKAHVDLQGLTW